MPAPDAVRKLVQIYRDNADDYRKSDFNEHQTRVQFINPFWKALGWDVDNSAGFAEAYKDVINEAALKVGGSTKAPDYSFGIAGTRKFFLEAKKPAVNIEAENDPAYQLRRYAYTAKFPLSVLTNFRQLAIYDGKIAPDRSDKASIARLKFYTLDQLEENWDEIAGLISREAVLKGAFDRFAAAKTKRGTAPVDVAFLREIEGWREMLARDIAAKNSIGETELNLAVGRIIDRIIFLRICEENGVEPGAPLMALKSGPNLYPRLLALFYKANERYNSGLFHFDPKDKRGENPDEITPALTISNVAIKNILARLFYPETPYAFDVLPLDILGQIYERFLGKVIVVNGKNAAVEEKPEVRKAGGVYYTPSYIVNYIVAQTVGKQLETRAPDDKEKLKILDPACGSGSFLLGAYDYLLKWHLQWYCDNDPQQWAKKTGPPIYQIIAPHSSHAQYQLTARERKRIVLDHIYGVDLDAQAVEVTKLSLALKVLEGETAENIDNALKNHNERGLPDLGANIKCGNSLIEPDFYNPTDSDEWTRRNALSEAERARINDFNWRAAFPAIFKAGGFDAVIGNPPYGAEIGEIERSYLSKKYKIGTTDTAALMMERGRQNTKSGGLNGMIVPKPFSYSSSWAKLRTLFLGEITEIIDVGKAWNNVKLEQLIYVSEKGASNPKYTSLKRFEEVFVEAGLIEKSHCKEFGFLLNGIGEAELSIGLKMRKSGAFLGDFVSNTRGGMFQHAINDAERVANLRVIGGAQVQRNHLQGEKGWIATDAIRSNAKVKSESILVQNIVAHIQNPTDHIKITASMAVGLENKIAILDTVNQLENASKLDSQFLIALLHSRLINWYVYRFIFAKAIRTMHFDRPVSDKIPIPNLDLSKKSDKTRHDQIVQLVETMLQLYADLPGAQKAALEKRIATTDGQIDALVYQLYGLSDDEIALVEGA